MKGVSLGPGDYVHFKSQVPLHKISIGSKQWRYYDFGPKVVPPLICLPGIAGTADVFYKQILALSMKGYRVISVDIPRVWNHVEWIQSFEKFLDAIDVHHVHLYGTSLGGFLAQHFAQHRPRRVRSLVLSNSFLEARSFSAAMPWSPLVNWTPSFLLKRYILTGIHGGPHEPFIADSVDFVVGQVERLSRDDLASRLSLNVEAASIGPLSLSDSSITIMDTNDYCAIPQQVKDELSERYPGARRALLKTGGDFPFLSRPDEVNLHLQLHLRWVGVEARPDTIQGPSTSRYGSAWSPSDGNDGKARPDTIRGPSTSRDGIPGSPSNDSEEEARPDMIEGPTTSRDGSAGSPIDDRDEEASLNTVRGPTTSRDGRAGSPSDDKDEEASPNTIRGPTTLREGRAGSPSDDNDEDDPNDSPKHAGDSATNTDDQLPLSSYDQLPPSSDAESHNLDETALDSAKTCWVNHGCLIFPLPLAHFVLERNHITIAIETKLHLVQALSILSVLLFSVGLLYTYFEAIF
ncbi:LOW QUALITY PROTEIN: alpha/beta-Hydrolases superfamily protein [Tasmannia lanceolata]|uniref:LOW QUALITY PROTEIN: alpha/beta-Hydrolases superfamily protein n=1 Tax=Tasmannia lanceolata TaxID=3420 RepID=UPI004063905F